MTTSHANIAKLAVALRRSGLELSRATLAHDSVQCAHWQRVVDKYRSELRKAIDASGENVLRVGEWP
jgi:hypothetical protein